MNHVTIRPDLKTAGGEVSDLLWNGRFVGTIALVYREGDRLSGTIQLDGRRLGPAAKRETIRFGRRYVRQMAGAVRARECEVFVASGSYEEVISNERPERDDVRHPQVGELVIVGESRNKVEYHLYGPNGEWLAEAFVRIDGADVVGEIYWQREPSDDEMERAARLIVSDFDEEEIDTFSLDMNYDGNVLETIELTHEQLLDGEQSRSGSKRPVLKNEYTVALARDDGDTLTYEIYEGGHSVGTATVDIAQPRLTGIIAFRDEGCSRDRAFIATLLLDELDKEKEYDSLHLTMLVDNKPIDELLIETKEVH